MMEEVLSQGIPPSAEKNFPDSSKLNSTIMHSDERLLDINTQHSLNALKTMSTKKAKRVRFFRNGDKFYTGVVMAVTPERYRSFDSLASELTRALVSSVTLPNGVRAIYTMDGKKVQSVSDLEDGKCYVVSGQGELFKKVEYSSSKVKRGSSLSGLPQAPAGTGRQISAIPLCVKAKIITLIRHGIKPRKVVRLLLNKRNAPSLEHAMEAITEAVKLDSGAVRKVYTLSGQPIMSLEQFFEQDDVFLAYGPEKCTQEDFELDFEESKYVQSFRRCPWTSKRQSGPMPRMPRKSGKKMLTTPQIRTPSPSTLILPQPLRMHYTVGHVIGDGNFAVVRHCVHKSTGAEYAIKIIDKYKCQGKETMLASEVTILQQVCHPNIISLITEQETTDQLFLVMELMKGGDLFDAIAASTKFSEADASVMIGHLTSALAYLHSHHIVHRDVKPENLLVQMDGGHVKCLKLGDFGLAQIVKEPLYTVCGTPTYVAPEILAETGYGLKIDVWAAGVILYILLCGFPPFVSPENEQEELFERILSGQYEFTSPYWDEISDCAKQLISNMLQPQPELRFSAEDVLDHPWLTSFLGGEQATVAAASAGQAKQHWDRQFEPVRLEPFAFEYKGQTLLDTPRVCIDGTSNSSTDVRNKWSDASSGMELVSDNEWLASMSTPATCNFGDVSYELSRKNIEIVASPATDEHGYKSFKLSRSASPSLTGIPENINTNWHSTPTIRVSSHDRVKLPEVQRSHAIVEEAKDLQASTVSSARSLASIPGNDVEMSDSFINIQLAQLAVDQKSYSAESLESTDSFENVILAFNQELLGNISAKDAEKKSVLAADKGKSREKSKRTARCNQAIRVRRLSKNDEDFKDSEKCSNPRTRLSTTGKIGRKFSSTDELTDTKEERTNVATKRFSLYYTPQLSRKIYESNGEWDVGLSPLKGSSNRCNGDNPKPDMPGDLKRGDRWSTAKGSTTQPNKHCRYLRSKAANQNFTTRFN